MTCYNIVLTETFWLLRNVCEKVVHVPNSPLILTSDFPDLPRLTGVVTDEEDIYWLIFCVTTQKFNQRNNRCYELMKK
jgi:hypothetical protein